MLLQQAASVFAPKLASPLLTSWTLLEMQKSPQETHTNKKELLHLLTLQRIIIG